MSISALCFSNASNQHTVSLVFKLSLDTADSIASLGANVDETIFRFLLRFSGACGGRRHATAVTQVSTGAYIFLNSTTHAEVTCICRCLNAL